MTTKRSQDAPLLLSADMARLIFDEKASRRGTRLPPSADEMITVIDGQFLGRQPPIMFFVWHRNSPQSGCPNARHLCHSMLGVFDRLDEADKRLSSTDMKPPTNRFLCDSCPSEQTSI